MAASQLCALRREQTQFGQVDSKNVAGIDFYRLRRAFPGGSRISLLRGGRVFGEVIANNYFIYRGAPPEFETDCARICESFGFSRCEDPEWSAFAIAPLLRRKLSTAEWSAPIFGTLIFHPSALPYRRGPAAIQQTIAAGERVSAATWFWCNDEYDAGPVCESEPVVLLPGESPGRAYHTRFRPAGLVALKRAVESIRAGRPRRIVQDAALATFDR